MSDPTENRAAVQAVRPTDKEVLDVPTCAKEALASCYNVTEWPADGSTQQDDASARVSDLHARLSQSTETVQPNYNPAGSDYTEAGSEFNADALAQEIQRVDGNHSLGAGALAEALMPFLSRVATEVGPSAMTGADVLRIFRPLPDDEVSALREVMPELYGDAEADPSAYTRSENVYGKAGNLYTSAEAGPIAYIHPDEIKRLQSGKTAFVSAEKPSEEHRPLFLAAPAQEAEETGGWRPIDSAPVNKKLLVGFFNPLSRWRTVLAANYTAGMLHSSEDSEDADENGYAPSGWYEIGYESEVFPLLSTTPTHWMSLLSPPASPPDREGERR